MNNHKKDIINNQLEDKKINPKKPQTDEKKNIFFRTIKLLRINGDLLLIVVLYMYCFILIKGLLLAQNNRMYCTTLNPN